MIAQNPADTETVRFQGGTFVQVVDANGDPAAPGAVSVANGADVAIGTTTDAPVADNTTAASATAATGISLWKRLVNLGIAILAKLPSVGTAGTASANVLSVQGIASGTTLPVTATLAAGSKVGPTQSSAAPTNTAATPFAAATADADVFTLAAGERGFIQNRDTDVLVVKLGTGASSSSGSFDLKACAVAGDGSGGSITIEKWIGVVSVAAATGTAAYRAWKI